MTSYLPLPVFLLSTTRTLIGTSAYLLPSTSNNLLFHPLPASGNFPSRAWGSRDALMGILLYTAKTPTARARALMIGAVVDTLDIAAAALGYVQGDLDAKPALVFGGGALGFLILAGFGWRGGVLKV